MSREQNVPESPHRRFVAAYGAKLKAVETFRIVSTAFILAVLFSIFQESFSVSFPRRPRWYSLYRPRWLLLSAALYQRNEYDWESEVRKNPRKKNLKRSIRHLLHPWGLRAWAGNIYVTNYYFAWFITARKGNIWKQKSKPLPYFSRREWWPHKKICTSIGFFGWLSWKRKSWWPNSLSRLLYARTWKTRWKNRFSLRWKRKGFSLRSSAMNV